MKDDAPLGTFEEQVLVAILRTGVDAYGMNVRREIENVTCLLYTSPSPRDGLLSRMPSSA